MFKKSKNTQKLGYHKLLSDFETENTTENISLV